MSTIVPLYCAPRSKASTGAILDSLDVEHRPEWQPRDELTHCNQAAKVACDALGVQLPAMLANDLQLWLDSALGRSAGWRECTAQRAGDRAEFGEPAVVTLHELPHGHIAIVRGRDEHGNLLVWQAGFRNFNRATLRQCFTVEQLGRVKLFTHV